MNENEEARFAIIRQLNELETRLNQVASDAVDVRTMIALLERNIEKIAEQLKAQETQQCQ